MPRTWRRGESFLSPVNASAGRHEPHSEALSESGHEVLHWSAAGQPTASDSEICAYARENAYVVLTNDLDFPQILAHTRESGPSVILLRGEPLIPEARASALLQALRDCELQLGQGAIVSLDWSGQTARSDTPLDLMNLQHNQARVYLLNQSIVRCQARSAAALL
jgi:predicted nuclease of predicted toxin-antitoxin system